MASFDGAVLAGGSSRRMGRDKALIEIDGVPMFRRALDALGAAGASTTLVVGGDAPGSIDDRWPGEGPLGGIITALGATGDAPAVAVVSCDLVNPDPTAIAALATVRALDDADVAVAVALGEDQWTFAVWHRRVADALEATFAFGQRAVRGAVADLAVVRVEVSESAAVDADTPDDLPPNAS